VRSIDRCTVNLDKPEVAPGHSFACGARFEHPQAPLSRHRPRANLLAVTTGRKEKFEEADEGDEIAIACSCSTYRHIRLCHPAGLWLYSRHAAAKDCIFVRIVGRAGEQVWGSKFELVIVLNWETMSACHVALVLPDGESG
jgi:hypothetical protein